jgi:hypothetical protein
LAIFQEFGMMIFPRWSTASFGEVPVSSKMELSALGDHLHVCNGLRGRMFFVHCCAERMHGFMVSRFVTLWVTVWVLVGALAWAL